VGSAPVVLVDFPKPSVARLLINRPGKRNAIDEEVRQAMIDEIGILQSNKDMRALVLGGVDGVFSAGGDLTSMQGLTVVQAQARMQHIHRVCRLIAGIRIPVVCAVEGFGAGAAVGLALLSDYIVVGEKTKILFPFLNLGLTPDWGQLMSLPLKVGLPTARRILTSGLAVSGPEAFRIGLADCQVTDAEVMATAVSKAEEMAKFPLEAFARMKGRLNNPSRNFEEEFLREEYDQSMCLLSDDFAEGFDAFKTKRVANFALRSSLDKPNAMSQDTHDK
jgi:enoyl-CoA hydratase/carnithine racemase